ncbi:MAG: hypothetical protein LBT03_01125 [Holosporales bacterium]|jgi:hypothetical protein|nr:hypothetical protein [Holosporales bacterium]
MKEMKHGEHGIAMIVTLVLAGITGVQLQETCKASDVTDENSEYKVENRSWNVKDIEKKIWSILQWIAVKPEAMQKRLQEETGEGTREEPQWVEGYHLMRGIGEVRMIVGNSGRAAGKKLYIDEGILRQIIGTARRKTGGNGTNIMDGCKVQVLVKHEENGKFGRGWSENSEKTSMEGEGRTWWQLTNASRIDRTEAEVIGAEFTINCPSTDPAYIYEGTEIQNETLKQLKNKQRITMQTQWIGHKVNAIILKFRLNRGTRNRLKLSAIIPVMDKGLEWKQTTFGKHIVTKKGKDWILVPDITSAKTSESRMGIREDMREVNTYEAGHEAVPLGITVRMVDPLIGVVPGYDYVRIYEVGDIQKERMILIPVANEKGTGLCFAMGIEQEGPAGTLATSMGGPNQALGNQSWQALANYARRIIKLYAERKTKDADQTGAKELVEIRTFEPEGGADPGEKIETSNIVMDGKQFNVLVPAVEFQDIRSYMMRRNPDDGIPAF